MENEEDLLAMKDLRDVGLFLRRNLKLIAIITAGTTLLALLLAFVLPERFAGEAIVMLDTRSKHFTNVEAVVSGVEVDNSVIRSEISIIESRAVINRVIDELKLMHDPDFNPSLQGVGWLSRLLSGDKQEEKQRQESEDRSVIADTLSSNLEIYNDGRSYSILIHYKDRYPERAARIANAFADQYLVDQLEVKYETTQRANTWLSKRMESLREEVNNAEKAVEEYKIKNNLVGVGDETVAQKQLEAINPQLLQARAERSQAEARYKGIKDMPRNKLESSSVVLASPLISQLKQQEAEVRRKEADLATRYGDRHPMIINTRNELASIRGKIGEEIDKLVAGAQNDFDIAAGKVKSLENELSLLEGQTGIGNTAMITLRQLQREAKAIRSLYEGFLNRFKQVAEQQDLQMADARIVARAEVPISPYFPNPVIFAAFGMCFGVVIGYLIAFLLEYLDRGYRSLSLLEKAFGVSGLGIVPLADTANGQLPTDYVLEKPLSNFAEALRSIRTAIHFSNVDTPPKVILVTSSLPGEGKTIFCCTFMRILAKSGMRVLLIDSDMRRPRVHSILGLDKTKPGLAPLLAGDAQLSEALQKDISGGDVIIASGKTPNPQELLASKQMERLVNSMRDQYDIILLDAPPIMAVADAAVLSRLADAPLFIVKWASTPREVITESLKSFKSYKVKLAGVVMTQVDLEEHKRYGYGDYGYYYGRYKDYYTN